MTLAEAIDTPRSDAPTLRESLACVNCELIFRKGSVCPSCGSASLMNLADIAEPQQRIHDGR